MRTIEKQLYTFDELNDKAKAKALEKHNESFEFFGGDEILETIKKGLEHFDFKLNNYSIDWTNANRSSWSIEDQNIGYDEDGDVTELAQEDLAEYFKNNTYYCVYQKKIRNTFEGNCPFTGVCYDEDFLDPIRKFITKPTNITFKELIDECIYNVLVAGEKEYDYQTSEAYFIEDCEANDYEFYEDGTMY